MDKPKPNPLKNLIDAIGEATKDENPDKIRTQATLILGGLAIKNPKVTMQVYKVGREAVNVQQAATAKVNEVIQAFKPRPKPESE